MPPTTSQPASRPTVLPLAGAGSRVDLELGPKAAGLADALTSTWRRCLVSPREGTLSSAPATPSIRIDLTADPDAHLAASSPDPDALLTATTQAVTHALITGGTGTHLMFHAGALAHPVTNRAVVLVAPGGTGKTTLTRTLGTRYRYLTDETVAIDTDGRVLPYPKPLSIRTPGRAHKVETPPDELGLLPHAGPAPLKRILILDRADRYGRPQSEEMDLFDAVMELAPQTSALSALDAGLQRLAGLIEATGPVLKVHYRDAQSLGPLVADLIGEA
ncbi:hypothetical protein [Acidipropionibacterium acidipropionici]|uniref:hypothetical protein n=1 Tax=Acidipropionibacterium acidipropionici TaxID=1748 RepID=UPI00110B9B78|nr:hypothetical protein [Acidipropionibacterium acidipropionici]QCV96066.1 hypothetical protein FEZ30_13090 [Acidipropionibacterium acidipropionici]